MSVTLARMVINKNRYLLDNIELALNNRWEPVHQ